MVAAFAGVAAGAAKSQGTDSLRRGASAHKRWGSQGTALRSRLPSRSSRGRTGQEEKLRDADLIAQAKFLPAAVAAAVHIYRCEEEEAVTAQRQCCSRSTTNQQRDAADAESPTKRGGKDAAFTWSHQSQRNWLCPSKCAWDGGLGLSRAGQYRPFRLADFLLTQRRSDRSL